MYFKTDNEQVLKAVTDYTAQAAALKDAATAFAQEFDAIPVMGSDGTLYRFRGLNFNSGVAVNRGVWTENSRQFGHTWLRSSPKKKADAEEWNREKQKWAELHEKHFPNGDYISNADVFNAIGFSWGDRLFSGFKSFIHDGYLYIETSFVNLTHCVEIYGSEYQKAQLARNAEQQAEAA